MDIKVINDIVWYIPFKKLRNAVREYLIIKYNKLEDFNNKLTNISNKVENIDNHNKMKQENLFYNLWKYSLDETVEYLQEKAINSKWFNAKNDMYDYIFNEYIKKDENYKEKLFLEFGVYYGSSINYFSSQLNDVTFYGFDAFEGLVEDSGIWNKNDFSTHGHIPQVNNNVLLEVGYFCDTLPTFFKKHKEKIAFMHIDSDTYSAAVDIFNNIVNNVDIGTIIVFDEYFNYPAWKFNEYKAFQDFCNTNNIEYKYLAITNNQAAIRIEKIN
ncbi:class I SAM-dependent methyltransferase [Brachyspira intermedia]|uniref:class I SAM-dependent methyltransferase n=1 Tax=Brachyspira intermedia TaxID=84377 RepID=UPI003004D1E9